jgi:hypothetical protein
MRLFQIPYFHPFNLTQDDWVYTETTNHIYFNVYWKVYLAVSSIKKAKGDKLGPMINELDVRGDAQ